jgi:hypothetical protein
MSRHHTRRRLSALAVLVGCIIAGWSGSAAAQPVPDAGPGAGVQVLTRGPVHEAFAEPVIYDPRPGPVVPKPPPAPVEELPPDQKPEGANVQWIPGYWSWDESRNDYVWVSGIWRDVPPGRNWVPGYWSQVQGGYQWTPGFWESSDQNQIEYLPPPPPSLDTGPNTAPPSPNATWSPGFWTWQDTRYVWRPGVWVPFQPDWLWVPSHYVSTPSGYVFVNGYWDRPLQQRGTLFAPVYFQQPLYQQPNYVYTPSIGILGSALLTSLFVRPSYHQYYFGDYYGASNFQSGIYPWYSFHQSRYGYDPLFAHAAALNTRRDPDWINHLHNEYRYLRDHPEDRPAPTYAQQQTILQRQNVNFNTINTTVNNISQVNNLTRLQNQILARPISHLASMPNAPVQFESLAVDRRRQFAQQATQLRQFSQERIRREAEAARPPQPRPNEPLPQPRPNEPLPRPRRIELPRSPIVPAEHPREPGRLAPPPPPSHPQPDLSIMAPHPGAPPVPRHEPHPEQLPPGLHRQFRPEGAPSMAPHPGAPPVPRHEPHPEQLPPGLHRQLRPEGAPSPAPERPRPEERRRREEPRGREPGQRER